MLRMCDEDSGRSSCSAGSLKINPILEMNEDVSTEVKLRHSRTQEASTNTDLKVSLRPRSCVGILKSPDVCDPFPSCKVRRNQRNTVFSVFDTQRRGGLSNAHSTYDITSNTQLEEPVCLQNNAVSLITVRGLDEKVNKQGHGNFRRGRPVQRAASRLYRADAATVKGENKGCVGPEFIVRASQPVKHIDLTLSAISEKRIIKIVLLNGQNIEALCDPNTTTAGQLFEAIVCSEKYKHNFMLGIAVLMGGDFVFLPDDYKIKKVAPENWNIKAARKGKVENDMPFTVFLRIKFFLPTNIAKNIQGGDWRYRVYLQLRRATVEGQLTSTTQNLILLAGYALHIEFGEFSFREHGSGDYFLLEHYLPEGAITNDMADIKLRMKRAHESRRGLEKGKAVINYITLAQTFRDYGAHFYSAIWATRDGFCRDIWLSLGPKGVTLYSRNNSISSLSTSDNNPNRIVLQSLPWHHIHTFYYNKKCLYIIPNGHSGLSKMGIKYKLKMLDNKSYFTFWLASLHHRLYLKLYAKDDFVNYLSDELSYPYSNDSPVKGECSNYQDSYNLAVRNPLRLRRQVKRRFRVGLFDSETNHNKENKPNTEELLRQILSPHNDSMDALNNSNNQGNSSNDGISSSESCSLPRSRQGVKMGTRVFNGMKTKLENRYLTSPIYSDTNSCIRRSDGDLATTQSDSDDLCSNSGQKLRHYGINSMKLLPERQYHQNTCQGPTAYVIESPKVYQDAFAYNLTSNESCLNASLYERLDSMGCVQGERVFVTALLQRDSTKALGLQVAEGSDGNVYIKSITSGGPADLSNKLIPGDQIISVNGQTLINVKYDKALAMLQAAPSNVELIVLQNANKNHAEQNHVSYSNESNINRQSERNKVTNDSVPSGTDDIEITDDELLNEEALKTIYTLIKLTKDKVVKRMKEKGSLSMPNRTPLHKCLSENKVYDESDIGDYSSQENTPEKRDNQKFNTWRGQVHHRPKRRPLSLSIPTDANLPEDYLNQFTDETLMKKSSLKSIQSSLNEIESSGQNSLSRNVPLPRNFGLSRKWLGPVRYPVTPCKNSNVERSAILDGDVVRKHFVYGAADTNGDQIFL